MHLRSVRARRPRVVLQTRGSRSRRASPTRVDHDPAATWIRLRPPLKIGCAGSAKRACRWCRCARPHLRCGGRASWTAEIDVELANGVRQRFSTSIDLDYVAALAQRLGSPMASVGPHKPRRRCDRPPEVDRRTRHARDQLRRSRELTHLRSSEVVHLARARSASANGERRRCRRQQRPRRGATRASRLASSPGSILTSSDAERGHDM